jgi:RNA polymerase sigma factor (TIGR02999 family)
MSPVRDNTPGLAVGAAGGPSDAVVAEVYHQLNALAQELMKRERAGHTLSATALVHEAYLRLSDQRRTAWESPGHFFAMAATMIRRVLVDHARARLTRKRGGDRGRITLSEADSGKEQRPGPDLLELDEALTRLAVEDARAARVVELRYFAGLGVDDCAALLGVSIRTVKSDWTFGRAWLRDRLRSGHEP